MAVTSPAPPLPVTLPAVDAKLLKRSLELAAHSRHDGDCYRLAVLCGRVDRLLDRRLELAG